jgi:hypothetical protein
MRRKIIAPDSKQLLRLAVLPAIGLFCIAGCSHPSQLRNKPAPAEPRKYAPWQRAPGLDLATAINRATEYLRGTDMSKGYVLEASREGQSWWLVFVLLPKSPDYRAVVRVYDDGRITDGL